MMSKNSSEEGLISAKSGRRFGSNLTRTLPWSQILAAELLTRSMSP